MEAQIRIGSRRSFTLKQALLIYRDDAAAFATLTRYGERRIRRRIWGLGRY